MKVAYLTIDRIPMLKIASAYIKANPDAHHTIVNMSDEEHIEFSACEVIQFAAFSANDYDAVIPLYDKFFSVIADASSVPVLTDKSQLSEFVVKFLENRKDSFALPKEKDFTDGDLVIIKPVDSTATHDPNKNVYVKLVYSSNILDGLPADKYMLQEFLPSQDVVTVISASNGAGEIHATGVTRSAFVPDKDGKHFPAWVNSGLTDDPQYAHIIAECLEFLKFCRYDQIKVTASVQFMVHNNKYYIMDYNSRPGPVATEWELSTETGARIFEYLPFIANKVPFAEIVPRSNEGFLYHAVYSDTQEIVLPNLASHRSDAIVVFDRSAKHQIGVCRRDYDMHIYPKDPL